ncbi:GNAT family N-acetyltransferase [Alginatibacterium sediminis]|uniref:GNAT family N-acetyltransferase n=1 Tax=Alginatibacterium sediminis TaxID=2164068 RepID=A0A420EBL6_9ALTE|nr:GNAT family N-acetyltransferase [Alginatibacterium sediminis]RKF18043.1 GNAT family N-acetyltransferase [Alginatibacterium sediminis]
MAADATALDFRELLPFESANYRALRLKSLKEYPQCFGSNYVEQKKLEKLYFEEHIEQSSCNARMLGAFNDNQLLGICALTANDSSLLTITQMYVCRSVQGQGVAQGLLALAKQYLSLYFPRHKALCLDVYPHNQAALNTYLRAGFYQTSMDEAQIYMRWEKDHESI